MVMRVGACLHHSFNCVDMKQNRILKLKELFEYFDKLPKEISREPQDDNLPF